MKNINKSDTIRGGHIDNPKNYIQACIHNGIDTEEYLSDIINKHRYKIFNLIKDFINKKYIKNIQNKKNNGLFIDYYLSNFNEVKDKISNSDNMKNYSFVISKIDESIKYSNQYKNCTGIIARGISKENGKAISFLTHQDPHYFINGKRNKEYFTKELNKILNILKKKSKKGTIDIVILGGENDYGNFKEYKESINFLDNIIYKSLKFSPVIIGGPSITQVENNNSKSIIFDTQKGQIYFFKEHKNIKSNINFVKKDIKKVIEKLKNNI